MANQFLIKETMEALRNLSVTEIDGLKGNNPIYVGVQLLGYYKKGDTPAPVIYYYVNPNSDPDPGPDDGGRVIKVQDIAFIHEFSGKVNVKYFGIFQDIDNNYLQLQRLVNLLGKGITGIIIENSIIRFSEKLIFADKNNFTVDIRNSEIFDSAKYLSGAGSGPGRIPVGILFENCHYFQIKGFKGQSNCNNWFEVSKSDKQNLNPHLEFNNCSKVVLDGIECRGYVGGYLTLDSADSPYDMMRSCYVTFFQCRDVLINGFNIASGAGGGEFLSLNECENITINKLSHHQGNSNITFWSLSKIINCKNVIVDGLDIQSDSTGSLIDVAGENVTIQNGILDYPLGKLIDITFEWLHLDINSENIHVKNIKTNGAVCISAGVASTANINGIKFENVISTFQDTFPIYNLRGVSQIEINNASFKNIQNLITMSPLEIPLRKYKKIIIRNSDLSFELPVHSDLTLIELCGLLEWKDSTFGQNEYLLGLRFLDRYAEVNGISNLNDSISKVFFKDCKFINMSLSIPINIEFVNCTFENVRFYNSSGTYRDQMVKFSNCNIRYTNNSPIVISAGKWFEFSSILPVKLIFDNTKMSGIITNNMGVAIFGSLMTSGAEVKFINNCEWKVKREGGGTNTLFLINEASKITIESIDSSFEDTNFINFSGGTNGSDGIVNVRIIGGTYLNNFIRISSLNNTITNAKINFVMLSVNTLPSLIGNLISIRNEFSSYKFDWNNLPDATVDLKGLVNKSSASTDFSPSPSSIYKQSEILSILNELRDLKMKLRVAGILEN